MACMKHKSDYAVSQDKGVMDIVSTGLAKCATATGRLSLLQQYVN